MLELEFWGAAGEVTGSCYLLKVGDQRLLVDCGLIQGRPEDEARNRDPFPFDVNTIDAVVLSHAHLDHCGRLPLLAKAGYRGPIYTHPGSRDLCNIMLRDSAHINEMEAGWHDHHHYSQQQRRKQGEPLYTMHDTESALKLFEPLPYDSKRDILPGVAVRLRDAGHILGAAIIELWLQHDGEKRKLVFSGDLGHKGAPVMRDPTRVERADLVIMESTYGDRHHPSWQASWDKVAEILQQAEWEHSNVLIPSFAVGRSQDMLYAFSRNYEAWKMDRWQLFFDSPLAIEATTIYHRHLDAYNHEAQQLWRRSDTPFMFPDLQVTRDAEESRAINEIHSGALIIAGSGMCEGGRIQHHLKHNVWRNNCHVIIVGFQVEGTLGRRLVDGARTIELWGDEVEVNATIHNIGGFSAHADQRELCEWYHHIEGTPPLVLTHGEQSARAALAAKLRAEQVAVQTPGYGDSLNLLEI